MLLLWCYATATIEYLGKKIPQSVCASQIRIFTPSFSTGVETVKYNKDEVNDLSVNLNIRLF